MRLDSLWRVAHAHRVAFLVDADAYFATVTAAMERAQHSIFILGWETHSETEVRPKTALASFLRQLTEARQDLDVRFLVWSPSPVFVLQRQPFMRARFRRRAGPRVRFELADDHPPGGAHHEKLVVIDDALAFVGGIDLAPERYDRPRHPPHDPRRTTPRGKAYGPVHDVQMAVDGDAARSLAELFRLRWQRATDQQTPQLVQGADPWPPTLGVDMRDVDVGIARTQPAYEDREEVREIERALLSAIESARRFLYIESQYVTSERITAALAARLAEADAPEILIVISRRLTTTLERKTMGVLQAARVAQLRAADKGNKLRVVGPRVGDADVHVHTKLLIADDRLLILGSANLTSRSTGLDTECALVIDAGHRSDVARSIQALRTRLLAEHCGGAIQASLLAAVDRACDPRRARALAPAHSERISSDLLGTFADPDAPLDEMLLARLRRFLRPLFAFFKTLRRTLSREARS